MALDSTQTITIKVNSAQGEKALTDLGRIDAFEKAKQGGKEIIEAFTAAKRKSEELRTALSKQTEGSQAFTYLSKQLTQANRDLDGLRTKFQTTVRAINAERIKLNASGIDTNNLAGSREKLQGTSALASARVVLQLDKADEAKAKIQQVREALVLLKSTGVSSMQELARATANADREIARLNQEAEGGSRGGGLAGLAANLGGPLAAAYAIGRLTIAAVAASDALAQVNGKLRLVSDSEKERQQIQSQLFAIAQKTNTGYDDNVQLYVKLAQSTEGLNLKQKDLLAITKLSQQAFRISGASAEESAAGILQFGQALQSGVLQGDELRSIRENAPALFNAIVAGVQKIDPALGVTKGNFKALAAEGKITSDLIINALLTQVDAVNDQAQKLPQTLSTAFTGLRNEVSQTAAEIAGPLTVALTAATEAATALLAATRQVPGSNGVRGAAGGFEGAIGGGIVAAANRDNLTLDEVFQGKKPALPNFVSRFSVNSPDVFGAIKDVGNIGQLPAGEPGFTKQFSQNDTSKEADKLREEVALRKLATEEAKAYYQITIGSLKDATNQVKNNTIALAQQKDAEKAAKQAVKDGKAELREETAEQRKANKEATDYARAREESARAEEKFQASVEESRIRLLELTGQTEKARLAEIDRKYQPLLADAANRGDDAGEKQLVLTYTAEIKAVKVTGIDEALKNAQDAFNQQRDTIDAQVQVGDINKDQGRARLRDAQRDYLAVVQAISDRIETAPDLLPAEKLAALRASLGTIKADLGSLLDTSAQRLLRDWRDTTDSIQQLGVHAFEGLADALTNFVTTGKLNFKSLATSILQELAKIEVQKTIAFAVGGSSGGGGGGLLGTLLSVGGSALASYFGGSTAVTGGSTAFTASSAANPGGGFNLNFKALGGAIIGAGTGTSDSIPAMLSNGEYVLRAEAVKRIGVAQLDRINEGRGIGRMARFAQGGAVGRSSTSAAGTVEMPKIEFISNGPPMRETGRDFSDPRKLKIFLDLVETDMAGRNAKGGPLRDSISRTQGGNAVVGAPRR